MRDKLEALKHRYDSIVSSLSDPNIAKDNRKFQEIMREKSELEDVVTAYNRVIEIDKEIEEANEMLSSETDEEMREMAQSEKDELEKESTRILGDIRYMLIPKDKNAGKNIIVEIRAGTGGDESAIFAGDLFRMYCRFAENHSLKVEIMDSSETELGGYREVIFTVSGKDAYEDLKYESGTHRVQRVPVTESGGRIHTSAATVAVMPEAEETEVEIRDEDLRIDVFRAGGPGGQCVNTTDSAVRITHIPTNTVVQCQDEKSQHKNKAKAMKVLRARIFEKQEAERKAKESESRRAQIGTGDRSERIRTYNFPQNRVTDHRINLTLYKLESILNGELNELIEALKKSEKEELLKHYAVSS